MTSSSSARGASADRRPRWSAKRWRWSAPRGEDGGPGVFLRRLTALAYAGKPMAIGAGAARAVDSDCPSASETNDGKRMAQLRDSTEHMLEIRNLHAEIDGKPILKGVSLDGRPARSRPSWGRTARASRPSPTSSPASDEYEVTEGEVLLDGENLLEMEPDERAAKGLFLAFQYPLEIPGVATMTFSRPRSTRSARSAARRRSRRRISSQA